MVEAVGHPAKGSGRPATIGDYHLAVFSMQTCSRSVLLGVIASTALVAIAGVVSFDRANRSKFDFHHFYLDAAYVWQHAALNPDLDGPNREARRHLPFYLPAVPLMLAPLTAAGLRPAAAAWSLAHALTLAYCLVLLARRYIPRGSSAPNMPLLAIACVLVSPAVYEAARFNQFSFIVLALVLAGVAALSDRRPWLGGGLLGLAAVIKLLPAVFAVWLILKRKWAALAAFGITAAAVAVLPCLAVFGPQRTLAYHRQWVQHNIVGVLTQGELDPDERGHFVDHRNQSVPEVLSRLFLSEHPNRVPLQPLQLNDWSVRLISGALLIGLAAALLWITRRPMDALTDVQIQSEAAVYLLAMLIFSPLFRMYYLVWALPALLLLARFGTAGSSRREQIIGRVGLLLWIAGQVAWLSESARNYGVHLWLLIALSALLLSAAAARTAQTHTAATDAEDSEAAPPL